MQTFLKEKGVDSMIYYPVPIHYHAPYKHLANGPGSLPLTEQVSLECLSLPIHAHLSSEAAEYVASQILEFVNK